MASTGQKCTASGVYKCPAGHTIPLSEGETFPPCATCGKAVNWTLVRRA